MARLDAAGLTLAVPLPDGAEAVAPPDVDMAVAPGFSLVHAAAWRGPDVELKAVCVAGDAWFWAPGLEAPLLDAASALVRKTLGLGTITPGAIRRGPPFEQNYSSHLLKGRHWVGFRGDQMVVCSLGCEGDEVPCEALRDAAAMTSEPAPEPGVVLSAMTTAAAHPQASALTMSLAAVAVAAAILWRRPRPEVS
ncbi:MAG TPA: hypothetical protein ENK57_26435 [Polyangiaceae bacterium]|nr:hypothetical protein [Polyangiaceae bacterium]